MLYQRAATHLSVVRSRSPDPALVARLSRLVLAAAVRDHRRRRRSPGGRSAGSSPSSSRSPSTGPGRGGRASRRRSPRSSALHDVVRRRPPARCAAAVHERGRRSKSSSNSDFAGYYSEFLPQNFAFARVDQQRLARRAVPGRRRADRCRCSTCCANNALNIGLAGGVMIGDGRGRRLLQPDHAARPAGADRRLRRRRRRPADRLGVDRARAATAPAAGRSPRPPARACWSRSAWCWCCWSAALMEALRDPVAAARRLRIGIGVAGGWASSATCSCFGARAAQRRRQSADLDDRRAGAPTVPAA